MPLNSYFKLHDFHFVGRVFLWLLVFHILITFQNKNQNPLGNILVHSSKPTPICENYCKIFSYLAWDLYHLKQRYELKNSKRLYQITIKGWIYCHTMGYDAITCFNDLFFMFLKPNKIYNFIIFMHEQKNSLLST
jgi:hypothetical protein